MAYGRNIPEPRGEPLEPKDLVRIWLKFSRLLEVQAEFDSWQSNDLQSSIQLGINASADEVGSHAIQSELLRLARLAAETRARSKAEIALKARMSEVIAKMRGADELTALLASVVDDLDD